MRFLLDTHLLLWAAASTDTSEAGAGLSAVAAAVIDDPANELVFSAASIWEVAIKAGLGRPDFQADPHLFRRGLLESGYAELPVTGRHAAQVAVLPPRHKDPFDRMLIAQAIVEGMVLLTADGQVAAYDGPIRKV